MLANRNIYLDLAKVVLIYLVTLGHTIQKVYHQNNPTFWDDSLFKSIYIFHMPLFIAISGYFTYYSLKKHSFQYFFKSRFKYLFIPMLVWCILTFLIKSLLIKDIEPLLFIYTFETSYWYIWAILFYSILFAVFSLFKIDNIAVLLFSILLITAITFKPFQFHLIKSMYPFFVMGYIVARFDLTKIINFLNKYFIFILITSFICFFLWNKNTYAYITPSSFHALKITIFRFFAGSIVSISFLQIIYFIYTKIKSNKIDTYISILSKETLGIYLIQGCILSIYNFVLPEMDIPFFNNLFSIMLSIFIVIISHFVIYITYKNKKLGRIFFG